MVMRGSLLVLETNTDAQRTAVQFSLQPQYTETSVIASPGYIKSMKVPYCNFEVLL